MLAGWPLPTACLEASQKTWHFALWSSTSNKLHSESFGTQSDASFYVCNHCFFQKQSSILKYSLGSWQTTCMAGLLCLVGIFVCVCACFVFKSQRHLTWAVLSTATSLFHMDVPWQAQNKLIFCLDSCHIFPFLCPSSSCCNLPRLLPLGHMRGWRSH